MGRAKRLAGGTPSTGLAIEYVRTRKVVRILGWLSETPIEPVEIPVDELYRSLGISPRDIGAPQQFLLFAGSHREPGGGLRDLVGTFSDEEKAWAAFRDLRQSHPSVEGWAELAAMDGVGHVNQLAWFGLHQAPELRNEAPSARAMAMAKKHPAHRPAAGAEHPAYLRAVTGPP